MKNDAGKPTIELIPPECIMAIAQVFAMGKAKYGANNWREDLNGTLYSRTYGSIQRHLTKFFLGEDDDPESGLPHIDHALTQLCILKIQTMYGKAADDRWKGDQSPKLGDEFAEVAGKSEPELLTECTFELGELRKKDWHKQRKIAARH